MAAVFADVDSPIALAFLLCFPTPESARRLGVTRMAACMAQHRYSGRRTVVTGLAGEAETDAKGELVRVIVRASARSSGRSASLPAESSTRSQTCPTAGSSCPSRGPGESAPQRSWPSSATFVSVSGRMPGSPPRPASRPSPTPPAKATVSCSAGPATTACARPSHAGPTIPATARPGPPTSTGARLDPRSLASVERPNTLRAGATHGSTNHRYTRERLTQGLTLPPGQGTAKAFDALDTQEEIGSASLNGPPRLRGPRSRAWPPASATRSTAPRTSAAPATLADLADDHDANLAGIAERGPCPTACPIRPAPQHAAPMGAATKSVRRWHPCSAR